MPDVTRTPYFLIWNHSCKNVIVFSDQEECPYCNRSWLDIKKVSPRMEDEVVMPESEDVND